MNPITFSEILTDIPDSFIESAAEPHSKPIRWYQISAAAACIVLLIAAAVYPKLRIQTPEITEPPKSAAEVITSTTTAPEYAEYTETQTATSPIQTAFDSVTVTVNTTASLATSATATETDTPAATEPPETEQFKAEQSVNTKPLQTTPSIITEITLPMTTTQQSITVPLWKGSVSNSPSELIIDEEPNFGCLFRRLPFEQPDPFFEIPSQYDRLREEFSIPQDFDLTQEPLLYITIITGYKDTAITGCHYTQNGLKLTVSYLKTNEISEYTVRYAIPLPENLTVEPENCTVEYVTVTDESEYQALLTDSLSFELDY